MSLGDNVIPSRCSTSKRLVEKNSVTTWSIPGLAVELVAGEGLDGTNPSGCSKLYQLKSAVIRCISLNSQSPRQQYSLSSYRMEKRPHTFVKNRASRHAKLPLGRGGSKRPHTHWCSAVAALADLPVRRMREQFPRIATDGKETSIECLHCHLGQSTRVQVSLITFMFFGRIFRWEMAIISGAALHSSIKCLAACLQPLHGRESGGSAAHLRWRRCEVAD